MGPYNGDWTGFSPETHQAIVFDGFKGQLTIQQLELLCENEGHLNTKGGSLRWENKKFLVIVVSNYSIAECYHNAQSKDASLLDPLYVRFRSCSMTSDFEL